MTTESSKGPLTNWDPIVPQLFPKLCQPGVYVDDPNCSPHFANLGSTWIPIVPHTLPSGVHVDPNCSPYFANLAWGPRGPQVGKVWGTIGVHSGSSLSMDLLHFQLSSMS